MSKKTGATPSGAAPTANKSGLEDSCTRDPPLRDSGGPSRTTVDLVAAVKAAVPRRAWPRERHVATRTFQALRMAVNEEVEALTEALPRAAGLLAPGGRLGVISFHSGEDRIVKRAFLSLARGPYAVLEPSPLTPCREEILLNPRCRSDKLRVLERAGGPHGAR